MPSELRAGDESVLSGINKQRVNGPVMVRKLNIDGDGQADLRVHGGADKAVYCYPSEHYSEWQAELGRTRGAKGPGACEASIGNGQVT
jgi:MOSC domain-containing protein YiiM